MNLLDSFYVASSVEKFEPILRKVIIYNFSCQPAKGGLADPQPAGSQAKIFWDSFSQIPSFFYPHQRLLLLLGQVFYTVLNL